MLLYELLTGSTPLDRGRLRQGGAAGDPPPDPRGGAAPAQHPAESRPRRLPDRRGQAQIEPERLTALVRGDLDWIVMKALEKDRTRRYETASGLAARRPSATWTTSRSRPARRRPDTGCGSSPAGTGARERPSPPLLPGPGAGVSGWQAYRATMAERPRPGRRRHRDGPPALETEQARTEAALIRITEEERKAREELANREAVQKFFAEKVFAAGRPEGQGAASGAT